ncbi:MAG: ATP-dependent DNA helicase [Methanotrichaceae archaeon]|nr:ATP-dependent DNA helicase [Methanotrichaceae archaeon]
MFEVGDLLAILSEDVIRLYQDQGVDELYPPQAEAIERGLLEGKNMLISVPTAAGKTLLAELAMIRAAREGKRSLYIVPLRALAAEKYESFRRFNSLGVTVGISTGDFDRRDEALGRNDIIVATSEKADSLIRNGASWITQLGVLVADEIHLLNSANRGPTLEMTITKLVRLNPGMQVIGLSATVANGREVSEWLGADLVFSEWRPISLREGIILDGKMVFEDGEVDLNGKDEMLALVRDTMALGAQMLIFENSRRNAEATAVKVARVVGEGSNDLAQRILASGEGESSRRLADCVRGGSAFHHAGLLPDQRRLVEMGFRENQIKVIASTPTLAAGLNLPARRVLVRSYKRYDPGLGMVPIPVIEYRQMAGRAGRPGLDPYGESFLMAKSRVEFDQLMEGYIRGEPEEILSKLASESALRTHILSTISTGFAESLEALQAFMASTFYAHQQDPWRLEATIEAVLDFLEKSGMISVEVDLMEATRLGSLVSRLYIDPLSAVVVIENLRDRASPTEITLLHLITKTPDMELFYIQRTDGWLEEFIDRYRDQLNPEENYDWLLKEVKTTSMLLDWISEVKEEDICERYHIGPGDIRRVAETAQWLMHSVSEISKQLDLGSSFRAAQLEERIRYGAGPDLLALLEIKGIGRVRARKLHRAGYTSLAMLKEAGLERISSVIGPGTAEKVMAQLRD